mmetsp:Transcript_17894/g.54510  ORF Transcript_17894/g.54510 Transcript_17894/m.54510 type:complete len:265 (-) Transcript_17894:451-1245(-)
MVLRGQRRRVAQELPRLPRRLRAAHRVAGQVEHHSHADRHAEPRLRRDPGGRRQLHGFRRGRGAPAGAVGPARPQGGLALRGRPRVPLHGAFRGRRGVLPGRGHARQRLALRGGGRQLRQLRFGRALLAGLDGRARDGRRPCDAAQPDVLVRDVRGRPAVLRPHAHPARRGPGPGRRAVEIPHEIPVLVPGLLRGCGRHAVARELGSLLLFDGGAGGRVRRPARVPPRRRPAHRGLRGDPRVDVARGLAPHARHDLHGQLPDGR